MALGTRTANEDQKESRHELESASHKPHRGTIVAILDARLSL
jgi:hypothetical protein